jgi:hypothetical protein
MGVYGNAGKHPPKELVVETVRMLALSHIVVQPLFAYGLYLTLHRLGANGSFNTFPSLFTILFQACNILSFLFFALACFFFWCYNVL